MSNVTGIERILKHVRKEENGCWIWVGCLDKGITPVIHVSKPKRTLISARRYAYEAHNQVCVPSSYVVTSFCKNSHCVNPAHLTAQKRGTQGHRLIGSWKADYCQNGHEFSEWNTGTQRNGKGRLCLACNKERHRVGIARWRAENPEHQKAIRDKRIIEGYQWVDNLKIACTLCGETEKILLDYHHRDPSTKLSTISNAVRAQWSKKKLQIEIDKCDLLCVGCHRKHHTQSNWINRNTASQERVG